MDSSTRKPTERIEHILGTLVTQPIELTLDEAKIAFKWFIDELEPHLEHITPKNIPEALIGKAQLGDLVSNKVLKQLRYAGRPDLRKLRALYLGEITREEPKPHSQPAERKRDFLLLGRKSQLLVCSLRYWTNWDLPEDSKKPRAVVHEAEVREISREELWFWLEGKTWKVKSMIISVGRDLSLKLEDEERRLKSRWLLVTRLSEVTNRLKGPSGF